MEYKKDVRTDNLTLRDIHVGDWVQVWSETAERYSPPLKIIQICDDGTIYLVTSDEERPTPWEENIKNVDVLPITPELLIGFGFKFDNKCFRVPGSDGDVCEIDRMVYHSNTLIGLLCEYSDGNIKLMSKHDCKYMHELCDDIAKTYQSVNIEWKGLDKQT